MHLDKFDEAEGWLRSALQREPLHAIPYVNLGIIVAIRRQEAVRDAGIEPRPGSCELVVS